MPVAILAYALVIDIADAECAKFVFAEVLLVDQANENIAIRRLNASADDIQVADFNKFAAANPADNPSTRFKERILFASNLVVHGGDRRVWGSYECLATTALVLVLLCISCRLSSLRP